MIEHVDESKWTAALARPDGYLDLQHDIHNILEKPTAMTDEEHDNFKDHAYAMVERLMAEGKVVLGQEGYDFDTGRQLIDTVVIHHTANPPGIRLSLLNAEQLIRLYMPYYANPTLEQEMSIKGQPLFSGHYYHDQQVFWAYHWQVRDDGTYERILEDRYVGWHAGSWDVNCRSVGICLDGDFRHVDPNEKMLEAVAEIVRSKYPQIRSARILGHMEVVTTKCPGKNFLDGWKQNILAGVAKDA
ncbi:N-acetylmuramoyl-L-alanine amidase [Candidatus Microgenomates bacterium]|nr:N-acetylmuramoyl-L-alanine amidase [Candidatus Microgenomates bacterium]